MEWRITDMREWNEYASRRKEISGLYDRAKVAAAAAAAAAGAEIVCATTMFAERAT